MANTRLQLLEQLAYRIVAVDRPHPVRVAIDGMDAAGKTTLADELIAPIERRGRPVIRVSIDGFHRPRADRYRRGPDSPEGYFYDSFDYQAIRRDVLEPLGPGGSRQYRRAVFDFRADAPLEESLQQAPGNAVLLLDGVFLLRPELRALWDLRIFVRIAFTVSVQRAILRDQALWGSAGAVEARYRKRYLPGQELYLKMAQPEQYANIIVANDDPEHPRLLIR